MGSRGCRKRGVYGASGQTGRRLDEDDLNSKIQSEVNQMEKTQILISLESIQRESLRARAELQESVRSSSETSEYWSHCQKGVKEPCLRPETGLFLQDGLSRCLFFRPGKKLIYANDLCLGSFLEDLKRI